MLRVVPEGPPAAEYRLRLVRDVPITLFWILALVALLLPPGFALATHLSFKSRRWAESDYADDD